MNRLIYGILIYVVSFSACKDAGDSHPPEQIIANVGAKKLTVNDLHGLTYPEMPSTDSALLTNAYVERWVRDQVLLIEAEKHLPENLNLDELVQDYRNSLLRLNYEEQILNERLDSTISNEELIAFYEKNKEQYQLEKPILRCFFMKVPIPMPRESEIQRFWNRSRPDDISKIKIYAQQYAQEHLLNDSIWHTLNDISELIPSDIVNSKNININTDWTLKAKNFKYYLKVLEMKSRKDIAPLSFIEEQASRAILHRRKAKIINEWRETLYDKALKENLVNIN